MLTLFIRSHGSFHHHFYHLRGHLGGLSHVFTRQITFLSFSSFVRSRCLCFNVIRVISLPFLSFGPQWFNCWFMLFVYSLRWFTIGLSHLYFHFIVYLSLQRLITGLFYFISNVTVCWTLSWFIPCLSCFLSFSFCTSNLLYFHFHYSYRH